VTKPIETRKALGKGLSALLPQRPRPVEPVPEPAPSAISTATVAQIPITLIDPNPLQPRTVFQADRLQELADSISQNGVIQPLIVRRQGPRYELVAGERRWRASRLAGFEHVPCVIQDIADEQLMVVALIENIQREDLNPIEVAQAYERLIRELNLTHEEIGRRTGKDRASITNIVRLLRLPKDLQILVAEHRLSTGAAKAILGLPTEELQRQVAEKTVSQGLSVRAVERAVQAINEPRTPNSESEPAIDPNVRAAIDELERALGTRVRIVPRGDQRGRIEIEYYSQDELHRIYGQIVG